MKIEDVVAEQAAIIKEQQSRLNGQESEISELYSDVIRLRELLDRCDVVMDTSAMHGLPQSLPPMYKDSWAWVHQQVRTELRKGTEAKADNTVWVVG